MNSISLKKPRQPLPGWIVLIFLFWLLWFNNALIIADQPDALIAGFQSPPDSARPGVYWYFMDGNLSREGMTADLESMKEAGIGNLIFLEVNVGVPRGPVEFMSEAWQEMFRHAVREAERLGIEITLGSGPGWTGSGGPWVKPQQSMQHLVASAVEVAGPVKFDAVLPPPNPRPPYFGNGGMSPEMLQDREVFYADAAVLAFPTPKAAAFITDIDEKALYIREPFSSKPGVRPYIDSPGSFDCLSPNAVIKPSDIVNLTKFLQPDGRLTWDVPAGNWTILRFGRRNTGANTRPAPMPGLGFECDKFDPAALDAHFEAYFGKLLRKVEPREKGTGKGWTMLHIDSWEMGAQNWTAAFHQEFQRRRGYDPLPYLPVMTGRVVESVEISERFLWDLRLTAQELIIENHAQHLKELGRRYGLGLSIEPYDMNPTSDLVLGSVADVPMCEFWADGYGFNTAFSCFESPSIAHTHGRPIVAAEAFTSGELEAWKLYPGAMKNQGDWAFCMGINRFVYHTFAHKPWLDYRPGMTMGPYGVHWDRTQTWWPMVLAYHRYIARCQFLLRQGNTVADICYLVPEGAPHVFCPPLSATEGTATLPDRRGYNFDACDPETLITKARVKDGVIVFPGGSTYRLLILPYFDTMTLPLLKNIKTLVESGATVIGVPPRKSPSLSNYPKCDQEVQRLAAELWGSTNQPAEIIERKVGLGKIIWGGDLLLPEMNDSKKPLPDQASRIYPDYDATARVLAEMGLPPDFEANGPVRYTHRRMDETDIYFVANRQADVVEVTGKFRIDSREPQLWDPLTGEIRPLSEFHRQNGCTAIPLRIEPYQSFFIIFRNNASSLTNPASQKRNFPQIKCVAELDGSWDVSFDPRWGGPGSITFPTLEDWTLRLEPGIKYYSGIAAYKKMFDLPQGVQSAGQRILLDLGVVHNIARVRLNGKDLGVLWTAPWRIDITDVVQAKGNCLEIEVANLWPNRLIGDEQEPDDCTWTAGGMLAEWPSWLLEGKSRPSGRYAFTTYKYYQKDSPLLSSGLLGPVSLCQ